MAALGAGTAAEVTTGEPEVLVVGTGPTGLTLALQAHQHGASVG